MNREDTKKAIEVMQAFIDGGEVEARINNNHEWVTLKSADPAWGWSESDYRIKPQEPREFWMYPVPGGFHVGMDGQTAKDYSGVIKVREVL